MLQKRFFLTVREAPFSCIFYYSRWGSNLQHRPCWISCWRRDEEITFLSCSIWFLISPSTSNGLVNRPRSMIHITENRSFDSLELEWFEREKACVAFLIGNFLFGSLQIRLEGENDWKWHCVYWNYSVVWVVCIVPSIYWSYRTKSSLPSTSIPPPIRSMQRIFPMSHWSVATSKRSHWNNGINGKLIVWLMSPPCQPFTRQGKQDDLNDRRTDGFVHLMKTILPQLTTKPQYILLENCFRFRTFSSSSIFSWKR